MAMGYDDQLGGELRPEQVRPRIWMSLPRPVRDVAVLERISLAAFSGSPKT